MFPAFRTFPCGSPGKRAGGEKNKELSERLSRTRRSRTRANYFTAPIFLSQARMSAPASRASDPGT